jgi:hypothetical protein
MKGMRLIALIAQARLDRAVRKKMGALLAADTDSFTPHDIAARSSMLWSSASAAATADRRRPLNLGREQAAA